MTITTPITETATFASGCFWCTEAIFKRLKGVTEVTPGYANGKSDHATYESVHAGSGHTEALQLNFDPAIISYEQLVEVFFGTHDPTTLNRQGNDVGEEYRSAILFHTPEQQAIAEQVKTRLEQAGVFSRPIVTSIEPLRNFSPAEAEHRDYYANNPDQPYCQIVISPKVTKLREKYSHLLADAEN